MKIALLQGAFGAWGGAEQLLALLAEGFVARGHHVTVMSGDFSEIAHERLTRTGATLETLTHMHGQGWKRLQVRLGGGRARVDVAPLADHVVRLDRGAMVRGAGMLARRLQQFDVVSPHNFPSPWWVAEACWRGGDTPPVVWHCNEPSRSLYPGLFDAASFQFTPSKDPLQAHDRKAGHWFGSIVYLSHYVAARGNAIFDRDDARVVYPGIPLDPYVPRPQRRPGPFRVLTVNRLVGPKNVDVALDAVRKLPDVELHIVGDGPLMDDLRARAAGLERVRFDGFLGDEGLRAAYADADALLFIPTGEPFGLVLLEAAALGVPAVASNHGGPSEIVVEGQTGTRVDPTSAEAVAAGLRRLQSMSPEDRRRLGDAARLRVEQLFSVDRFVSEYERIFQGLDSVKR